MEFCCEGKSLVQATAGGFDAQSQLLLVEHSIVQCNFIDDTCVPIALIGQGGDREWRVALDQLAGDRAFIGQLAVDEGRIAVAQYIVLVVLIVTLGKVLGDLLRQVHF